MKLSFDARHGAWLVGVLALAGASLATSCASSPNTAARTDILQPDYIAYKQHVDVYLQRRCGTLDCHGQPGRAYRIYSVNGLRPFDVGDAGNGTPPTSGGGVGGPGVQELETRSNYESAIALEPEEMSRVVARQGQEPNTLMLLRKPRLMERHKGGPAMTSDNDPGYQCVVAWLAVRVIRRTAATGDFETIPEGEREQLSAAAAARCAEAASYP